MVRRKIILDSKFKKSPVRYIVQSLLALIVIAILLMFFNVAKQTALIAALGATAFIAFGMPQRNSARPRYVIGGYVLTIIVGVSCYYISQGILGEEGKMFHQEVSVAIAGALSVGLSIFIMAITNTEHPPAVSVALGLVVNEWTWLTLVTIIVGALFITTIRWMLKPYLIDLIGDEGNAVK